VLLNAREAKKEKKKMREKVDEDREREIKCRQDIREESSSQNKLSYQINFVTKKAERLLEGILLGKGQRCGERDSTLKNHSHNIYLDYL
jgi:hypothetical protein